MKKQNLFSYIYSKNSTTLNGSYSRKTRSYVIPVHEYITSKYSDIALDQCVTRQIYEYFQEERIFGEYNVLIAPCGKGKTHAITRGVVTKVLQLAAENENATNIIPVIAVPNRVQISQLRHELGDINNFHFYNGDTGCKISLISSGSVYEYPDNTKIDPIISVYDKCGEILETATDNEYSRMLLIIDEAHELLQARDYRHSAIHNLGILSCEIVRHGGMVVYMTGTPSCLAGGAPYTYGGSNQFDRIWEFVAVEEELTKDNIADVMSFTQSDSLNSDENIVIRQQDDDPAQSVQNSYNNLGLTKKDEICTNLASQIIQLIRSGYKPFVRFNNINLTRDIKNVIYRMGYNAVSVDSTKKTVVTDDIGNEEYENVIYDHVIRHSSLPFYDKNGKEIHCYFSTSLLDTGTNINGIERNGELISLSEAGKVTPIFVVARREDFSFDHMMQFFSRLRFKHKKNVIYIYGKTGEYDSRIRTIDEIIRSDMDLGERFINGLSQLNEEDSIVRGSFVGLHRYSDTPMFITEKYRYDGAKQRIIDKALLYYNSYIKYQRQYFYGSREDLENYLKQTFSNITVEDRRIDMETIMQYQEAKEELRADVTETCNRQMDAFFNAPEKVQNEQFVKLMNGRLEDDSNFLRTLQDVDSKYADPIKFAVRSIVALDHDNPEQQKESIEDLKFFIGRGQKECYQHVNAMHYTRIVDKVIEAYDQDRQIKGMILDLAKSDYCDRKKGSVASGRVEKREALVKALATRQVNSYLSKDDKGTFKETANDFELWERLFMDVFVSKPMVAALQLINLAVITAYDETDDNIDIRYALTLAKSTGHQAIYRLIHAIEMASFTYDKKMTLADCTVSGFEYAFLTSERAFKIAGFKHTGAYGMGRWIGQKITPEVADRLALAMTAEVKFARLVIKQKYTRKDIFNFIAATYKCERSAIRYQDSGQGQTVLRITGIWLRKSDIKQSDANFIINMGAITKLGITEEGARELYSAPPHKHRCMDRNSKNIRPT